MKVTRTVLDCKKSKDFLLLVRTILMILEFFCKCMLDSKHVFVTHGSACVFITLAYELLLVKCCSVCLHAPVNEGLNGCLLWV